MRALTSKPWPNRLFSSFKETADGKPLMPVDTDTGRSKSTAKNSSKDHLFARLGLRPLPKTVNSSASSLNFKQASSVVTANKRSSPLNNGRFGNTSSPPILFEHTAQFEKIEPQQRTPTHGFVDSARTSKKEEETLLTLRFEILKLPTNLSDRCNESLAKILTIKHPGRRIDMLELLLSKIPGHFSEKNTPDKLVMTSFMGVTTEMTRKKSDEVTAMRCDLLKLHGPLGISYQNILRDLFARPHSEDRDNLLTQMSQDINAHLTKKI